MFWREAKKRGPEPISLMRLVKVKDVKEVLDFVPEEKLIVEKKADGWLTQTIITDTVRLYSRRGQDITENFPEVRDAVVDFNLPKDTMLLGELVWIENGKQSLNILQSIAGSSPQKAQEKKKSLKGYPKYIVFDLLWYDGEDLRDKPLKERRELLEKIIHDSKHIELSKTYPFSQWKKAMIEALKEGGEGIVLKNLDAPYYWAPLGEDEPKPDGVWYKFKGWKGKEDEDDFVVYDRYISEKGKLMLKFGQYYKGELYHVGEIDNLSEENEKIAKAKKLPFVINIGFQERTEKGKLRHQHFIRFRDDKAPKDCKLPKQYAQYLEVVG